MNLGDKLRQLRRDRNLTQPELAEAMGIEQSYLSKLENSKYVPSGDIFGRILSVFELEVGDFVDELDQGDRNRMRQIPAVAAHFDEQKRMIIGNRRRWLIGSAVLVAVGIALIYAGSVNVIGGDFLFSYESPGIVPDGEPKELFRGCFENAQRPECSDDLRSRLDRVYLQTRSYRGELFSLPAEGGTRTYYAARSLQVGPAWQNKAIGAFGVLLAVFGIIGIILEKKLSRYQ